MYAGCIKVLFWMRVPSNDPSSGDLFRSMITHAAHIAHHDSAFHTHSAWWKMICCLISSWGHCRALLNLFTEHV